jgi:hypothetical protein
MQRDATSVCLGFMARCRLVATIQRLVATRSLKRAVASVATARCPFGPFLAHFEATAVARWGDFSQFRFRCNEPARPNREIK